MKRLVCLLLSVCMVLFITGCSDKIVPFKKYNSSADMYYLEKDIAAENDNLKLTWDDLSGVLELVDKKSGAIWTTASVKDKSAELHNAQLKSPIMIKYYSDETKTEENENAFAGSMYKEMFSAEGTENGLKVTYYFDKAQISVPVYYALQEERLLVTVKTTEIRENTNKLISIQIMPFLCSVNNSASSDDNYLFVPSGTGALIYPKSIDEGVVSILTEQVYGNDEMNGVYSKTQGESIKLPVYGAKVGKNALFAIIEKGADNSEITTNVGSKTYGFSSVYASFNIRGAYYCESTYMNWYTSKKNLYSDDVVKNEFSVAFYPLSGEDADYVGMAEVYRNYLFEQKDLKEKNNDTLLNLKFIGGIDSTEFTLGIPHSKLMVTTTFDDIKKIVNDLRKESKDIFNIGLFGFTPTGCTIDKVAGGFKTGTDFGDISVLNNLNKSDKLFFNFDILRFSTSGAGISTGSDFALSAIGDKIFITVKDFVTKEDDYSYNKYLYVSRNSLVALAQESVKTANKWGINGICLDTLTSQSYSDYSDSKFIAKSNMDSQVSSILKAVKKAGLNRAAVNANDYAVIESEHIYDAPIFSAGYQIFDVEVPFYEIVFKGYRSMSTPSLNLSANSDKTLLRAVEMGMGITYTLIGKYDDSLINSPYNYFYNSEYDKIKNEIIKTVSKYKETFEAVKNSKVKNHIVISGDLRKTEFDNGIVIYVNYSDKDLTENGIEIGANSWSMVKEG